MTVYKHIVPPLPYGEFNTDLVIKLEANKIIVTTWYFWVNNTIHIIIIPICHASVCNIVTDTGTLIPSLLVSALALQFIINSKSCSTKHSYSQHSPFTGAIQQIHWVNAVEITL